MILAKAPLRVSFFGGGSDIPEHYRQWGGDVVSMAVDKYVYVAVNKTPHDHIKVSYSKQELVTDVEDIENEIVKNVLKYFNIKRGIDISSFADIPTVGTGLAGSSAFTCALIKAICGLYRYNMDSYALAAVASDIEINWCGWKIGKQDQYASAFGGMNHFRFHADHRVSVNRIDPNGIDDYMLLIPTNISRHAAEILGNVDFEEKMASIRELSHLASLHSVYLPEVGTYGEVLNECWKLKKRMSNEISNPEIDALYERCVDMTEVVGAKLLGAGGGGYMLVLTHDKEKTKQAFPDRVCLDVKVANYGAEVVYYD